MIVAFVAAALSIAGLDLSTQNLKGEPRVFPADIAQRRAVVVVTFSKSASDEASEWTRKLRENQEKLTSIYQIAILENVPALFRSFVISALRHGIPKDLHDNFWIATSSSKEWGEHIGSASSSEAHVFVLENRSQITWRVHGAFSEPRLHSLLAACSR